MRSVMSRPQSSVSPNILTQSVFSQNRFEESKEDLEESKANFS
jgi:hypothetical protein